MDEANKCFTLGGKTYVEGDYISLDGTTGNIYGEAIPTVPASISGNFGILMGWADKFRQLQVRTNADTPKDAKTHLTSALKASACAVPSTCSLIPIALLRSVK